MFGRSKYKKVNVDNVNQVGYNQVAPVVQPLINQEVKVEDVLNTIKQTTNIPAPPKQDDKVKYIIEKLETDIIIRQEIIDLLKGF